MKQTPEGSIATLLLGAAARDLRRSRNLSQREMAKRLGITPVHLCNIEKDKSSPSLKLLNRWRAVVGIDLYGHALCCEAYGVKAGTK